MKNSCYSLLFILLICVACKDTSTTDTTTTQRQEKTELPVSTSSSNASDANTELQQSPPLTEYAKQFFTRGLWHYEAAVVIKDAEKGKSYQGKWIQLNPDNTLTTGYYDGAEKSGRWAIDEAKNIITLVEGTTLPTYSEWTIKTSSSSDDIMIWVGTKRFGTNNTQIKMIRYMDKPLKKND